MQLPRQSRWITPARCDQPHQSRSACRRAAVLRTVFHSAALNGGSAVRSRNTDPTRTRSSVRPPMRASRALIYAEISGSSGMSTSLLSRYARMQGRSLVYLLHIRSPFQRPTKTSVPGMKRLLLSLFAASFAFSAALFGRVPHRDHPIAPADPPPPAKSSTSHGRARSSASPIRKSRPNGNRWPSSSLARTTRKTSTPPTPFSSTSPPERPAT